MSAPDPDPPDPDRRLRVAIYAADGSVRGLLSGTLATIEANLPPGGTWRALPASVRKIGDVRRLDRSAVERAGLDAAVLQQTPPSHSTSS